MKKQLLFFKVAFLVLLLSAIGTSTNAQTNIAPAATVTGVGLSTTTLAWTRINDLDTGTTTSGQQCWISTGTPPSATPGVEWWAFTWPTAQSIAKIKFYLAQNTARTLTGCALQKWDGTNWVTFHTWSVPQGPFSFTISFNPVVTTAIRFTSFQMTGAGQQSNPNFREIEVITGSLSNNDIGVTTFNTPGQFCSPGTLPVNVTLANFGLNQVTSATVNWSVNNVLQTPYLFSGLLDTINGSGSSTTNIALGSYTFPSTSVNIKVWSESPNANTDTIRTNDSVFVSKAPSMSGSYTINPAGSGASNFLTFDAAIAAMSAMEFVLQLTLQWLQVPIPELLLSLFPDIVGANSVNTITFDGVSSATRIITGSVASSAIVVLNSTKYITFKNFKIINTNATTPAGFAMVGSTKAVTLKNCIVNVPSQATTSSVGYPIIITGTANGAGQSACSADSILVDSNVTNGGGYAITCYGASSAATNRGIVIKNNTIVDCNYMGMYILNNYNPLVVKNNTVNMNGYQYGYYGIYLSSNQSSNTAISHDFSNNKILGFGGYGLYITTPLVSSTAAKVKVHNNVLSSSLGGSYPGYYGIYLSATAGSMVEVYHNTVSMNGNGSSTSYTCMYNTGSSNVFIKNNIFAVYGGTYTPVYLGTSPTGNQINYNNYYNINTSGSLVYRNAVFYTAANYKNAANGGDSSFNVNPSFVSRIPLPGNLSLTDGCDGYGVDLTAFVPTDINGTTRSITPNPGAFEFNGGLADNIRVTQLLTPTPPISLGTQDLKFIVKNIGNNSVSSYNASYRLGTASPVTIVQTNTVGVCALDTAVFTGTNQITLTPINNLAIYTDSPNSNSDADKTNDTLKTTLIGPLSGVYTVGGTTPDYATPALAAAALQYGISGPVTFDIRPGTYSGQVVVNGPILGATDSIRVTFEGNSNATRIITANVVGATFLLNNANYVTVQNLKVINTNTSTPVGIGVVGAGSSYATRGVKIRKCDVSVPIIATGTSSVGFGINFTGTTGATAASATGADSSEIDSNIVTGGGYGIVHYGSQNAAYNRGLKIRGNTVNNCNYMGMYIYYNYNPIKLLNNNVNMQAQNYGYYGIYYYYNQSSSTTESHEIIGNRVNNFGGYGLYIYYPLATTTAAKVKIYNNQF